MCHKKNGASFAHFFMRLDGFSGACVTRDPLRLHLKIYFPGNKKLIKKGAPMKAIF
jgi:hypothetical protein